MDLSPYFIGAVIGAFLAGIVVYLLFKSTSVDRKEFDALNAKHNEATSNLKLSLQVTAQVLRGDRIKASCCQATSYLLS